MRYRLRLVREDDLPTVMAWRMLPEVTCYMYTDPQLTIEQQRTWFERICSSDRDLVWIIEAGDPLRAVGLLSLSEIDRTNSRCSWAYYLGDLAARGVGLAKALELNVYAYVFDRLGLNKLCCEVFCSNDRVVALHEKFGSKVEGVLRQHVRKNGEYLDVVRLGMLRSEWDAVREKFSFTPMAIESPPSADA